ncbi:MAG: 3,4-dihydroxy-2-butanone-4-phosphate synthase [Halobacteriovoraceae bacterium]|nr:3,4-dihydroxy-2-butanone-4-phosphate synthase [Halobacteriovoraceae bacterium]MCB9095745.1 3,4-dihydroxy-2-butanone-4-phosphate synthase [Halobacteriovoraceae bacterium]
MKKSRVPEILDDLKAGKIVIVTDHQQREDEGDFVLPAQFANKENINFMARFGRGLICSPLTREIAEDLDLPLMVCENDSKHQTAFTVSIDAAFDISTGISAYDRAYTLKLLADPEARPEHFVRPGHIFPLIAQPDGVLEREGHTEASVDLMKLAGLRPVAIICEIMNDEGEMARGQELVDLAEKFDIKTISIDEIIEYRMNKTIEPRPGVGL